MATISPYPNEPVQPPTWDPKCPACLSGVGPTDPTDPVVVIAEPVKASY